MSEEIKTVDYGGDLSPLPKIPSKSPSSNPVVEHYMDFYDALRAVVEGNKVTRKAWDEGWYVTMGEEVFEIVKPDGKHYGWYINRGDTEGVDWFVVKNVK